jgi:hypothetical protein
MAKMRDSQRDCADAQIDETAAVVRDPTMWLN